MFPNVPKVVLGTLCACISATLGGSTFVLTRLILPQTDAFTLCFLRYFLMFLVLLLIFRPKLISTKYYDKDIFYILFLGVIYFGGFPVCVAIGLSMTQASDASLVFATMP
ncbi:MAG: DMT family transporter, partial [Rickettsiales bacterium]|nr:DMT family transporter [Rickettsiales bacterium]